MNAFKRIHRMLIVSVSGLTLYAIAQSSHAYCVVGNPVSVAWSYWIPDLHIPVYVTSSGGNSVANTGHSPEDVARIVSEVIARHNESVAVPKLRFAGFKSKKYWKDSDTPYVDLDEGITVMSFKCEDLNSEKANKNLCGALSKKVHACAGLYGDDMHHTRGWILLLPAGCDNIPTPENKWTLSGDADLAGTLMHELGHTLGLQHTNVTQTECEAGGNVHGGDPNGGIGVMHGPASAYYPAYRSWRRDDLEGLDFLYHTVTGAFELARWNDDEYPDYPAQEDGVSMTGIDVSRSAAVSNQPDVGWQVLATTTPYGRVHHRVLYASDGAMPDVPLTVVDPTSSGRTWGMPAAAGGRSGSDSRIFVAWFANEQPTSPNVDLRVATRSLSDLEWTFENHPEPFRINRLAAGFVPGPESFIVTTMHDFTSEIMLLLFDAHGMPLGPSILLEGIPAFDVGAPLCTGSRCLIPYSEPVFGGPNFGIVEVEFAAGQSEATVIGQEVIPELDTRGRLGLFEHADGLLATIGAGRIGVGNYPGIAAEGVLKDNGDWPLGLGHFFDVEIDQWRMFQPLGLECGNGVLQATEGCDDMNDIPGDGCHGCELEPLDDVGNGDDEVGDDFGGDGESGEEDCECGATNNLAPAGMLLALGLLALRRRRAGQAQD